LLSEFAGPSPIEFDLALEPRRVFSSALRCSAPQRLELVVALLELLKFGDGGTNAEGRPHGDLTRIGFGIGDEFGSGLDPKRWIARTMGDASDAATGAMSRMKLKSSFS
jgi:hypothetical protein